MQGDSDSENHYSILLQNAETVALVCPFQGLYPRYHLFHFLLCKDITLNVNVETIGSCNLQKMDVEVQQSLLPHLKLEMKF